MSARGDKGCCVIVEDWMFDLRDKQGKPLTLTTIMLYALIYGFTKHGVAQYFGSVEYTMKRLRASRSAIKLSYKSLREAGLIVEAEKFVQGRRTPHKWVAVVPEQDKSSTGSENNPVGGGVGHQGQKPTVKRSVLDPDGADEWSKNDQCANGNRQVGAYGAISYTKASNKNPTTNQSFPSFQPVGGNDSEGWLDEYAEATERMMEKAINTNASEAEVKTAFLEAINKGYTVKQIERGFDLYLEAFIGAKTNPRFAKRLDKFLRGGDGLRYYAPRRRTDRKPREKPSEETREETEEAYADEHPEYKALMRECFEAQIRRGAALLRKDVGAAQREEALYEELMKKRREYKASHEPKAFEMR